MRSARRLRRPVGWSWSAAAGSAPRSPPRSGSWAAGRPRDARCGAARTRARHRGRGDLPRLHRARASSCCRTSGRRPSEARTRSTRSRPPTARGSRATWSSSASVPSHDRASRPQRASTCGDGILVDERLETSVPGDLCRGRRRRGLAPALRAAAAGRALGQRSTPGTHRRAEHARHGRAPTTGSRISIPTSTTSAWSTPGSPRRGTASSSAASRPTARSSRSGSWTVGSWRA